MSIAFTKELEGDLLQEELPDRPLSPHRNLVTPEGLAHIEAEVARLEREVSEAQHMQEEDRHLLSTLGRDLRYWMARRSTAELVQPIPGHEKVHFGSTVTIEREDGRHQRWRIVGEDEADPAQHTISHVSPLARALVNKVVGDAVDVNGGEVVIVKIE
jgi:transcription elongation GreA/GreB family factor